MSYLFDNIANMATTVQLTKPGKELVPRIRDTQQPISKSILDIYPNLVERMKHAPRFLMDDTAMQASVELSLGRPKVIREALEHCQVPYPEMWIEWQEDHRLKLQEVVSTFVPLVEPGRPMPQRIGFLIESEQGGRKGVITWVWTSRGVSVENVDIPHVSPVVAYFDLDAKHDNDNFNSTLTIRHLWGGNPIQQEALYDIWRTAVHAPSEWGMRFLQDICRTEKDLAYRLSEFFRDVYGEYITVWTIILLLTASRKTVDYTKVDRTKLNKARAKRRQIPLLDYTEVTMHVSAPPPAGTPRAPLGYIRKSPRVHLVSRYLARRGDKHWIVEPYMRGSGTHIERHVHVR